MDLGDFLRIICSQVWNAAKFTTNDSEQPHHEMDVLAGHENDVNYVQFWLVGTRKLLEAKFLL